MRLIDRLEIGSRARRVIERALPTEITHINQLAVRSRFDWLHVPECGPVTADEIMRAIETYRRGAAADALQ